MFGRKKDDHVQTFVDGVPDGNVPEKLPDLDIPVYPEQQQQREPVLGVDYECPICFDFGFYADKNLVWHHCPRCNPPPMMKSVEDNKKFANKGLEAIAKKKEAKK